MGRCTTQGTMAAIAEESEQTLGQTRLYVSSMFFYITFSKEEYGVFRNLIDIAKAIHLLIPILLPHKPHNTRSFTGMPITLVSLEDNTH